MPISRRNLVTGTGASALGMAGLSNVAAQESATPEGALPVPDHWDAETDVVVVGSGAAASTAAISARESGAEVLMLEKADNPGGTSVLAFGIWVPNNAKMRERGIEDPRDAAIAYMARLSYPSLYDPELEFLGLHEADYALIETYYDKAAPTFEFLERTGALKTMIAPSYGYNKKPNLSDPDYHADLPENKAPYGRDLNAASDICTDKITRGADRSRWGRTGGLRSGVPAR